MCSVVYMALMGAIGLVSGFIGAVLGIIAGHKMGWVDRYLGR